MKTLTHLHPIAQIHHNHPLIQAAKLAPAIAPVALKALAAMLQAAIIPHQVVQAQLLAPPAQAVHLLAQAVLLQVLAVLFQTLAVLAVVLPVAVAKRQTIKHSLLP